MCNFHEAVAVRAATDNAGNLDPGHKALIRVALSRFWAERYVDGAEDVTGYNPYPLATAEQQDSFARSGLARPLDEIERDETQAISILQQKILALGQKLDLSSQGLSLPIATAREPFINMAISKIYKGDPKGQFDLAESVDRDDLRPLHKAVSELHADPETRDLLERLVKGKICTLYTEAPDKVNPSLVNAYQSLPKAFQEASSRFAKYSGNLLLGGFSGLVGHSVHYGSVLGAGIAAGTASTANLAFSGVFLLAAYGGWNRLFGGRYQSTREQVSAFTVQAGLTVAIAFSAQAFMPHDHMSSEKAQWYSSLPPEFRDDITRSSLATYNSLPKHLRDRLDIEAKREGVPPEVFLLTCSGNDPVSQDINVYLTARNAGSTPRTRTP